jgi:hypothetical protein
MTRSASRFRRYRLRTLLAATAAAALVAAYVGSVRRQYLFEMDVADRCVAAGHDVMLADRPPAWLAWTGIEAPWSTRIHALVLNAPVDDGLARSIGELSRLESLCVYQNSDAALAHWSGLTGLKTLHLEGEGITPAGLRSVENMTQLMRLSIRDARLNDEALAHLRPCRNLLALTLDGCGIGDAGLKHLGGFTRLNELWLENSPIADAGLAELRNLQSLESLYLVDTQVTGTGFQAVQFPKLRELFLPDSPISNEGLKPIAALPKLNHLDLTYSAVSDAGMINLASAPNLATVVLSHTGATEAALTALAPAPRLNVVFLTDPQPAASPPLGFERVADGAYRRKGVSGE